MARHCRNCRKEGHYAKRCPGNSVPDPENINLEQSKKTLKEIGREILALENKKIDREPDEVGTLPRTGLWIVNLNKKRIAGKISQVKKDGSILWRGFYGDLNETPSEVFREAKYLFIDLEPEHLKFEVTNT